MFVMWAIKATWKMLVPPPHLLGLVNHLPFILGDTLPYCVTPPSGLLHIPGQRPNTQNKRMSSPGNITNKLSLWYSHIVENLALDTVLSHSAIFPDVISHFHTDGSTHVISHLPTGVPHLVPKAILNQATRPAKWFLHLDPKSIAISLAVPSHSLHRTQIHMGVLFQNPNCPVTTHS